MSAGEEMRRAREAQGMTLEDVASVTKLRASILAAMESDDFTHCGGTVYARGQLRTIAPVIGLDPQVLVDAFERDNGRRRED